MQTPLDVTRTYFRKWLANYYGIQLERIAFVPGGECSWTYLLADDAGERYVLKVTRGGLCSKQITPEIIRTLNALYYDFGIRQMSQPPVRAESGDYVNPFKSYRATVTPFIAGKIAAETDMNENHARRLGALLATLHNCKLGQQDLPPSEAFASDYPRRLARILRDVEGDRLPHRHSAHAVADLLTPHIPAIRHLANHFVVLEDELRADADVSGDFVVCHGDPTPWNIVITPEDDIFLIDWDTATVAPRERDLFHVFRNQTTMESYERIAGEVELNPYILHYYRMLRDLGDIVEYAWRLMYLKQDKAQVAHDLKQLERHLKGIGFA